jgi:tetratricopeptide (TPR) repeat protein
VNAVLEAVQGLRVAEPDLGVKPLLAKLREQRPDLEVASKDVREALRALDTADEGGAPSQAAQLPKTVTESYRKLVAQQRNREVSEEQARIAAQKGDEYERRLAAGLRHDSSEDMRRAARALREAIALRPDKPEAYYNLGSVLAASGQVVEAAQVLLQAKERYTVGSKPWARATAWAFDMLRDERCDELAAPEWWDDEGLKTLSARVVKAAPNGLAANSMRAVVLHGRGGAWEVGPRSAAELTEAATHFGRAAAACDAPAGKAELARLANVCLSTVVAAI